MGGLLDGLLSTPAWLVLTAVFALPALESSAFLGFVFPGETAVLLGGVVASRGHAPFAAVLAAAVVGAIVGDSVGYLVGRRWGDRILGSALRRFVNAEHVAKAERALVRRGGLAVFLGRFTVALRVMVPGLAGMAELPYRRFAAANVAGAVVWGALMVTAGYLAGNSWHAVAHDITGAGVAVTAVVVALLVGLRIVRRVRSKRAGDPGAPSIQHPSAPDSDRGRPIVGGVIKGVAAPGPRA